MTHAATAYEFRDKAADYASLARELGALLAGEALLGVLDLDSPLPGRFDAADARGLEALAVLWVMSTCETAPAEPAP